MRLPALMLQLDAASVLADPAVLQNLDAAVTGGATAVVLSEGASSAPGGAARHYDISSRTRPEPEY